MLFKKNKIQWADDYIKELINNLFPNFEIKKINPLVALKSNMKKYNEFDTFDFEYEGKIHRIIKGELINEKNI